MKEFTALRQNDLEIRVNRYGILEIVWWCKENGHLRVCLWDVYGHPRIDTDIKNRFVVRGRSDDAIGDFNFMIALGNDFVEGVMLERTRGL